jgi:hypothetical protein
LGRRLDQHAGGGALSKRTRRKSTISLRQRAAIVLAQLYRVADVQRGAGETLASGPWLKALANVLSSFPEGWDGSRRGRSAPAFIGLSAATLMQAATRCGLAVTLDEIKAQVAETGEWRAQLSKRPGVVRYAIMRSDKIGELLGVTDEVRAEARAWNLGTYGGSPQERERARKERDRMCKERKRRAAGAKPQSASLSKTKPWEMEGVSRRTWYRRRAVLADGPPDDGGTTSSAPNRGPRRGTTSSGTTSSATNRDGGTTSSATNILIELRSQECDHAPDPSLSPASLAYQEKAASAVAPRDDEWVVRKAPGGGIIVADLIPLEGFSQIGRMVARYPDAVQCDRAQNGHADTRDRVPGGN